VYADWLDERGTDEARFKAEYLRLDVHVAGLDPRDPQRDAHIVRLRTAARLLTSFWKASVAKLDIERCGVRWEFLCPKKWDELTGTPDALVRHCSACQKDVHYCTSIDEARALVGGGGHCVVIDLRVRREADDLPPRFLPVIDGEEEEAERIDDGMDMGLIEFDLPPREPETNWWGRLWRRLTGR
jgi:hypothetical protein